MERSRPPHVAPEQKCLFFDCWTPLLYVQLRGMNGFNSENATFLVVGNEGNQQSCGRPRFLLTWTPFRSPNLGPFGMTSPQNFLRLCSSSTWFHRVWKLLLVWKGLGFESELQFFERFVPTAGGRPAEGGPHAMGRRLRNRVRHHRPREL